MQFSWRNMSAIDWTILIFHLTFWEKAQTWEGIIKMRRDLTRGPFYPQIIIAKLGVINIFNPSHNSNSWLFLPKLILVQFITEGLNHKYIKEDG